MKLFLHCLASIAIGLSAAASALSQDIDPMALSAPPSRNTGQQASANIAIEQAAAPDTTRKFRADTIEASTESQNGERESAADRDRRDPDGTRLSRARIKPSEFEVYVSDIVDKSLRRFGAELLVPSARGFTTPPNTTVPLDYRLNPGDSLIIGLTGAVDADNLRLTVDSEGRIFVPKVGSIIVGGTRYGDLQGVIERAVSRQYRSFRIAVSIAQLHGITVYLTGFVATPGSYTISSLSTLVNAVLAGGGPAAGGSFRDIKVRRGGRLVSRFDLYDLLLRGDPSGDIILQNGDVIFVGAAGPEVGVIGSVNSEAIFEAKPGETLADIVRYAGGVNTVADNTRLLLLDPLVRNGWASLATPDAGGVIASRGQIVRILSGVGIAAPVRAEPVLVTVSGEVRKPGRYFLQPGVSLAEAVGQAGGLTSQAYPYAAVFTRESIRMQERQSFQRAVDDVNLLLSAQPLTSSTTLALQPARLDAVRLVVAQLEARKPNGRLVLDLPPDAAALPGALILENNDAIYVPPIPVTVGVFGAVPSPSSFTYVAGTRVGTVLARAGGVTPIGDAKNLFLIRANGTVLGRHKGLSAAALLDQTLLPGDLIFVPLNARRGELFAKIRDLTGALFSGALGAATIAVVAR